MMLNTLPQTATAALRNRNMANDDFFMLDFATSTASTTTTTTPFENKDLSSILLVGKKGLSTTTTTGTAITGRKTVSLSPVFSTIESDNVLSRHPHTTMHQLKVSAVPLSLASSSNIRTKIESCKKSSNAMESFEKTDGEDGSTLADFLNLLSPDPGFESACGGDCSPPPVDLSALDGLSLDFPLNGCCNGDTGYGSSSSLGGGSPHSSATSVAHPPTESETHFSSCKSYSDPAGERKSVLSSVTGNKRKMSYSAANDMAPFVAKKSFIELSPSPAKRPNVIIPESNVAKQFSDKDRVIGYPHYNLSSGPSQKHEPVYMVPSNMSEAKTESIYAPSSSILTEKGGPTKLQSNGNSMINF